MWYLPYLTLPYLVEVQVGRSCGVTLDSNFGQACHREGTAFGFSSFLCKLLPLPVLRELFLSYLSSLKSSAKKLFSLKKFFVFCFAPKVKFPFPLRLAFKATWCYTFIHHFIEYIILRMLKIGTSLSRKS